MKYSVPVPIASAEYVRMIQRLIIADYPIQLTDGYNSVWLSGVCIAERTSGLCWVYPGNFARNTDPVVERSELV